MDKQEWKEICRKTSWAGKKKKLSKKELNDLQDAQIALGMIIKKQTEKINFVEEFKQPKNIREILASKDPQ